eukprot:m.128929 g.128929  ORF g.128929 m.128929 type:complete len:364 (-) comp29361_c0_seq1:184-1275(-)
MGKPQKQRLPDANEIEDAMSDPDDIHQASNMSVFFVIVRALWYLIIAISCLVAEIMIISASQSLITDFGAKDIDNDDGKPSKICPINFFSRNVKSYGTDENQCYNYGAFSAGISPVNSNDGDMMTCQVIQGILGFGAVYATILFVITMLLLCNKKVKVSKSIIIEFVFSTLLMMCFLACAVTIEVGLKESCSACSKDLVGSSTPDAAKNYLDNADCQDVTTLIHFALFAAELNNLGGFAYPNFKTWQSLMGALRDCSWACFASSFFLFIMLLLRVKHACKKQKQGSAGIQTQRRSQQSSPKPVLYDDEQEPEAPIIDHSDSINGGSDPTPAWGQPEQQQQQQEQPKFQPQFESNAAKDGNPFG